MAINSESKSNFNNFNSESTGTRAHTNSATGSGGGPGAAAAPGPRRQRHLPAVAPGRDSDWPPATQLSKSDRTAASGDSDSCASATSSSS